MAAVNKPLYIEQGATFTLGFTWHRQGPVVEGVVTPGDPYDLTGCTARMQIRKAQGVEPPLVTATSLPTGPGAKRIFLGGPTGRIEITLTDEDTDLINQARAVYDLEIEWPLESREVTAATTTQDSDQLVGPANTFAPTDVGDLVTGTEIPADTVILSVSGDGTTATISNPATATNATPTLTVASPLRPRVDRLLQGQVEVSPNITQILPEDPVVEA